MKNEKLSLRAQSGNLLQIIPLRKEIINYIHVIYLLGRFTNAQFCSRKN